MVYPPRPSNISIPAVVAGNVLQNDDTSISVIDSGFDGTVVVRTQNDIAMIINKDQKVSINTDSTESMLTINNNDATTSTFRMSYSDSFYFDGRVTANGDVLFIPSCDNQVLDPKLSTAFKKNFNIADHDGGSMGLSLGGTLVKASASELNYVDVPAGVARPIKALVLNQDSTVTGINHLGSTTLAGTLTTGAQPNITSLRSVNITDALYIRGSLFDLSPATLNYIKLTQEGTAFASKAVVLDQNKNFTGINNLTASNITGTLSVGPQPNITSLSALMSLTNNGPTNLNSLTTIKYGAGDQLVLKYSDTVFSSIGTNATSDMVLRSNSKRITTANLHNFQIVGHDGATTGLMLGSSLVTATATELNYTKVTPGTAAPSGAVVLNAAKSVLGINELGANVLIGTLTTAAQPNITSVSTLNITGHNGSTSGLSLNGTLVTSSATQLNYLTVSPGSGQSSRALVLDSNKNISGINSLSASSLSGVVTTAVQPNINQVNTLTILNHNGTAGLVLGSTLVTATGSQLNRLNVADGTAVAGKALVVDGARNIVSINNLSANQLTGTLQTALQPNISQVNVLNISNHDGTNNGLSLGGVLVTSTATQLNALNVTPGSAMRNKALVLDSSLSISNINILNANSLGGTLTSVNQPNIRNLNSINVVDHNGDTSGLSLGGILVTSTANQINYVNVQQGNASASKALVLDSSSSITNINTLTATTLNGTIGTASQPFITRVSTLNIMNHDGATAGLSLNGTLIECTAAQINALDVNPGLASNHKALVVDGSKNIQGINQLLTNTIGGILITGTQPNLNAVNVLNVINHNGTTGLSLSGTLVTASAQALNRIDTPIGVAAAGKALIADTQLNISNINTLTASNLNGTLLTPFQPNIRTVGTLNVGEHDGGSKGLALNGTLVVASANQLNYNEVDAGLAIPNRSLVTDAFNSITGINSLRATKITAEQLSLTGVISNFNTGGVVIKSFSFTDLGGRMIDIQLLNTFAFNQFAPAGLESGYSCEIIGYINPEYSETYTFYVTCNDRVRLWVNRQLVLHSWAKSNTARTSSTVFLNANQWTPIYIQYQVDSGSTPVFLMEWESPSTTRGRVATARMAWDSNPPSVENNIFSQNNLTIYNTVTPGAATARLSVDSSGDLIIDASGNDIALGAADNLNIPSHDGATKGLYLGGILVKPTAFELNYLKVSPGVVSPSQAIVVDASKSITGFNSVSASSITCSNLSTGAFTISDLSLNGPLNNYNSGALLIRQFTGPDVSGRIVDVNTITDINLNNYDPKGLNTYYSLDIAGFILPTYSEPYRFHVVADDRVRVWVNNTLLINVWDVSTGMEYASSPIFLTAGQWTRIYIQYQNITGSGSLQLKWSSTSTVKSFINSAFMAWDNSFPRPVRSLSTADQLTIFSSSAGLTSVQTGSISVDGFGNLSMASTSGTVSVAANNNFNIASHNGSNRGLSLGGSIVRATAAELNSLAGATPGQVQASKVVILDSTTSLAGLTNISALNFIGTIQTPAQPNITSFGTLSSTLNTTSDILINSSNLLRLSSDANACYIQAGSSTVSNSASDLFIGNYGSTISTSSRKLMIKSNGFVGIQTSVPTRTFSINGAGATYCMRLINNSADGTETGFCDIGVDPTSNLLINSNMTIGSSGTASITVTSGIMKISPSGGCLQIGNTSNTTLPLEIGSVPFTLSTTSGYLNSSGSVGAMVPTATTYSMRTAASIIVNGTVYVTSDRRLKEQILDLDAAECKDFILNSKPVKFNYKTDPTKKVHCGLIAQDVIKGSFGNIVNAAPEKDLQSDVDSDGFVSPSGAALNVAYEEIIPVLMTTMKSTIQENEALKEKVDRLEALVQTLLEKFGK